FCQRTLRANPIPEVLMRAVRSAFLVLLLSVGWVPALCAQQQQQAQRRPTIETRTAGMRRFDGFVPFYWDEQSGQVWLEITQLNTELLYMTGLAAGLGSNDIG